MVNVLRMRKGVRNQKSFFTLETLITMPVRKMSLNGTHGKQAKDRMDSESGIMTGDTPTAAILRLSSREKSSV